MFKLWISIKKDVRILLRDKVGILLMFTMPIILVIVVTSIQNSSFQLMDKNKLPVIIRNNDTGQCSRQLIASIARIGMFSVSQTIKNEAQLPAEMHQADAMLGIVIPADFSDKVNAKSKQAASKALKSFGLEGDSLKKPIGSVEPLALYYNPVLQESLRLSVKGALQSALQMVESRQTLRTLYFSINDKQLPDSLENEMLNNGTGIEQIPVSKNGIGKMPNATQHNVPAWTIFAMFFVVVSLGSGVVREKANGSFIRLKTLPTNYIIGLLSKQITYLGVTMIQALVIFSLGVWLFPLIGLPALNLPADIAALAIITLFCGWCAISYAICIGVFAETQEQANGIGAVSIVILSAIGGLMVPTFAMQGIVKMAANFSPLHWCLDAYYSLFLENGKLKDILTNLVLLMGITLLIQFVTWLGLKRKNLI